MKMENVQGEKIGNLNKSPKFGRRELWKIHSSSIEGWVNNPSARTEEDRLKELKKRLGADVGQLMPISVVILSPGRYRLVDGHRRHAILTGVNGSVYFEAIVYPEVKPGSDLFGELFESVNSGVRNIGKRDRVWLALNGEVKAAGDEAAKLANEVKKLLDKPTLQEFIKANCPTTAFDHAKRAVQMLRDHHLIGRIEGDERVLQTKEKVDLISKILNWQIKQGQQQELKLYLTHVNKDHAGKLPTQKRLLKSLHSSVVGDSKIVWGDSRPNTSKDQNEAEE